ncbi:MAG TPA: hypothetical protein VKX45_01140 [Bryobacteraceae bacterium]|jgi:hypothetical protein|nr:hypothetical protein [Bryobacteraceae bacterium]
MKALGYLALFCFMFVFPAINFGFWLRDEYRKRDEWKRELEAWGLLILDPGVTLALIFVNPLWAFLYWAFVVPEIRGSC